MAQRTGSESLADSLSFVSGDAAARSALALVITARGTSLVRERVTAPHACRADVVVTVHALGRAFESPWCLDCLEDVDPIAALEKLVPDALVVSVRPVVV